jgi:ppGpp synthetase/RelA/SpoT-type nucleotidyltranferase
MLEQELGLTTTARLKTSNTIIEKLRRDKTRLAQMQDIAGVRIVKDMGIAEQDRLVKGIAELFPEHTIVDRRQKPNHGYRAVHVIARVDGMPVEIQVRTAVQSAWAQAIERLGDRIGRGIRYGEKPSVGTETFRLLLVAGELAATVEETIGAIDAFATTSVEGQERLHGIRVSLEKILKQVQLYLERRDDS